MEEEEEEEEIAQGELLIEAVKNVMKKRVEVDGGGNI